MPGYNGYANYETWAVGLWLDNDQGSYSLVREMAGDHADSTTPTVDLADALKELVAGEEMAPDLGASLYADLLGSALGNVDWHELAKGYLEEHAEDLALEPTDAG